MSFRQVKSCIRIKGNKKVNKEAKQVGKKQNLLDPIIMKESLNKTQNKIRKDRGRVKGTEGGRSVKWREKLECATFIVKQIKKTYKVGNANLTIPTTYFRDAPVTILRQASTLP